MTLTDPDLIADSAANDQSQEAFIDTAGKLIYWNDDVGDLVGTGLASATGLTGKCGYSWLKEQWRNDPLSKNLAAFPFPMVPLSDEFFELVDGWDWGDTQSIQLIRNSGFLVRNTSGAVIKHFAGIKTTGSTEADDQLTYNILAADGSSAGTATFSRLGPANEPIQVIDDPNGDGDYADGFNYSYDIAVWNRQQGQLFSFSSTQLNGESTLLAPKVYGLDASTGVDPKVTTADIGIDADSNGTADVAPYSGMSITYIPHVNRGAYADATVYAANDVVQDVGDSQGNGADRWYITPGGGTSSGADLAADVGITDWVLFTGEREIRPDLWYAFGVVIDGNSGTNAEIYEFVQWSLRQDVDIDAGAGTVIGNEADPLVVFVGDQLQTLQQLDGNGVVIDNYQAAEVNDLLFRDDLGVSRTFLRKATLILQPGANLVNDASAKYWVYYDDPDQTPDGDEWGTAGALLVALDGGGDMTGDVSGQANIQLSYDYDGDNTGGRVVSTAVPVVAIGLGLETGQYVRATGTIEFPSATIALVAPLERNYENP